MSKNNYNNQIYKMYEEETIKNKKLSLKYEKLRWEVEDLRYNNKKLKFTLDNINSLKDKEINDKMKKEIEPLLNKINSLTKELKSAYNEIERLKTELETKNYNIDKLECKANKNSSNSGITTSKEIGVKHIKKGANTYNHRKKSKAKSGGQIGHIGKTLTKEKLLAKVKENNIKTKTIIHYINGNSNKKDIVKYKIGMNVKLYVEEHIFKSTPKSTKKLPKEFYSDVTYNDELKSLVVTLGNYYSLGYSKVKEILYDFSAGIVDISEGTIDNIYEDFSNKSLDTINNITTNILNGKYQHTDETTTKENGKDSYYRGYANNINVLYKYHHHKGDTPIEEDNILNNYYGTIISDHDVGIFKYGTNNQDCVIHIGRYCIEANQNVYETSWQMKLYEFLLRCERTRKLAILFGMEKFEQKDLENIEIEYDKILELGKQENNNINSKFWKAKEDALLNRLIKYKDSVLFYLHDFSIPYDNNFMERCLRMIKGKTKVSGGFRSARGGERFGYIMSIIKTAKLRKLNPFDCIKRIFKGEVLFA